MPSRNFLYLLALAALAIASITVAAVAWARVAQLSLPLPVYLPGLNVLVTGLAVIAVPISRRLAKASQRVLKSAIPYLSPVVNLAFYGLFVLALVYATPSDMQSCTADRQWLRMFQSKSDIAIRGIQTRLRCCGYNSMRDRAWPFPSRTVNADTCERTQGYYIACGGLWRQELQLAAGLCAVASFLNWLLVVLAMNFPTRDEGQIRLESWWSRPARLTEGSGEENSSRGRRAENETVTA